MVAGIATVAFFVKEQLPDWALLETLPLPLPDNCISVFMRFTVIILLLISNCFMTYAWYGHLKDFKDKPLFYVILISWGIAFFEYMVQVPANRWGSAIYNPVELKTIQEVISLLIFMLFSVFYLRQPFQWQYLAGFTLICAGAYLIFAR